jgi:hypothetical protein
MDGGFTPDASSAADGGGTGPDAGIPDASIPDASRPDSAPPEARVLAFEGTSPVVVFYGSTTPLLFKVSRPNGAPVAGVTVVTSSSGTGAALNVSQATTDSGGVARFQVVTGLVDGQLDVTASSDRAPDVTIRVQVRVNPEGALALTVTSATRIPVLTATAQLWVAPEPPTCDAVMAASPPPVPTLTHDFPALPGQRTFTGLPTGHKVTVLVSGRNNLAQVGVGCVEGAAIVGGGTTPVAVTLEQEPTAYAADYDVLMGIALGNVLPEPYESAVGTVTAILADPAGWAVYQALVQADAFFVFTTFTYWDVNGVSVQASYQDVSTHPEVFNTWRTARGIVDTMLANQLGQAYVDVTTASGDIRTTVTNFEVGARYHLAEAPASRPPHEVTESWNDLVFTWRYGCAPGDVGCARRPVALDDPELAPAATTYRVAISHAPLAGPPPETERFQVLPEPHAFMLRYGAVILIALNEVVFPNLPASVAGDSLTEVVTNLVDCASLGAQLATSVGFGSAATWEGFCTDGIALGVGAAEGQLLALTAGGSPTLVGRDSSGVAGGGEYFLLDRDHDVATELLRDLTMYVAWYDPANGTSTEVNSPITGHGRLAASGCVVDGDCAAARVCQPVPSYLEVRAVEMDCRRHVGASAGMASCVAHADCAAGFCVGLTSSGGTVTHGFCYLACSGTSCAAPAACVPDGASYDLTPVREGLGEASAACCVAP